MLVSSSASSLTEPLNQHIPDLESQQQTVELSSSSLLPPTRLLHVPIRPPAHTHVVAESSVLESSSISSSRYSNLNSDDSDSGGLSTLAIVTPEGWRFPTSLPASLYNYIDASTYNATIERCNTAFTKSIGAAYSVVFFICFLISIVCWVTLAVIFHMNAEQLKGVSMTFFVGVIVLGGVCVLTILVIDYKETHVRVSGLRAVLELENVNYELRARSSGSSETHLTHNPLVWSIITTPSPYLCDDPFSRKYQIRISSRVATPGL